MSHASTFNANSLSNSALNPARPASPADGPKRIVVVGGVAGGMSFAARARRLAENAQIIVLERGPEVSYANCGLPYHVGGEIPDAAGLLVQTPQRLAATLNLDVRPLHEVIGLDAAARQVRVTSPQGELTLDYDALVLSPGASAFRPPIDGLDSPRVHTLRTVSDARTLRELVQSGARRAVVLGAGFIGIEAAEALVQVGLETSVVELAAHALPPLEPELAWFVTRELERLGVALHTGRAAAQVLTSSEQDTVVLDDGVRLPADLIVLAVGVRPATEVFEQAGVACERGAILTDEHGRTNLPGVWAVGDATLSVDPVTGARRPVALAGPANRAGRLVADHMFAPATARPIPAPLGTAIVRVGELTVAMTGANHAELERAAIPHHTLFLHPNQHAGYFPGAKAVHLAVQVHAQDGRLLGAQAVGHAGVDKRIDVLATALRAGLLVGDLIDLDLAYSPPYGQAKDPVNLVGMLGSNVLSGHLRLWQARDFAEVARQHLVLDVRDDAEVAKLAVPGALHIPLPQLRSRLSEVSDAAARRGVRILCASGVRSAIAHHVLAQAGFDSASLSGGVSTLQTVHDLTVEDNSTTNPEVAHVHP